MFWHNVLAICISYYKPKPNLLPSEPFTHKISKQIFCTEVTSVSLFWGGMFPNGLKNTSIKIKKQLVLTNFALVM